MEELQTSDAGAGGQVLAEHLGMCPARFAPIVDIPYEDSRAKHVLLAAPELFDCGEYDRQRVRRLRVEVTGSLDCPVGPARRGATDFDQWPDPRGPGIPPVGDPRRLGYNSLHRANS